MPARRILCILVGFAIAGCGLKTGSTPSAGTQTVSGDMLAPAASKGSNYQGTIAGSAYTSTIYVDPPSSGVTALVWLTVVGTQSDATGASRAEQAAITVANDTAGGYDVTGYTLYANPFPAVYASGALPPGSLLVPNTLTLGATFTPYAGMTATVTAVGGVPGGSACPTPANGATVQYAFQGQTYSVSYVPGCGITQYSGNGGQQFTLTSIGNYPQLGTLGDVRRMRDLTLLDTIKSIVRVVVSGGTWHPFQHR